jgi:hypothetical protein
MHRVRKEEIGEKDSASVILEREDPAAASTWGRGRAWHADPGCQRRRRETGGARSRGLGQAACWARDARPRRDAGKRGSEDGPCAREAGGPRAIGGCWAKLGRKPKERKFPFSVSFSNISKNFQIILNPLLNLNQTTQYKIFKCNSMSAQTCFYPYIWF